MITIPEMDHLPDNCIECPFSYYDYDDREYWCPWNNCSVYDDGYKKRMDDCPLTEIDPQEM